MFPETFLNRGKEEKSETIYLSVMVAYVLFTKRVMSGHFSVFLCYFIL